MSLILGSMSVVKMNCCGSGSFSLIRLIMKFHFLVYKPIELAIRAISSADSGWGSKMKTDIVPSCSVEAVKKKEGWLFCGY